MAQTYRFLKALTPCHRLSVRSLHPPRPWILVPLRTSVAQRGLSITVQRHAALAPSLPAQPTVLLFTPSPEYIEKEELDVELLPPEQIKLEITDRAAEVRTLTLVCAQYFAYKIPTTSAIVKNSRTRTKFKCCS